MRVAIYARVSTDEQASEGFSIDAQLEMLRAYAGSQDGWTVQDEYVDEGRSGRNDRRPEYRRMMQDSNIRNWDAVLVLKMDRIHRNSRNFMKMMDFLKKHGKEFVSSTESLDTSTAMGRFVIDMIQRIAQLESEQIGERTRFGMREKAESLRDKEGPSDGVMGFAPPFGYAMDAGSLVADEAELEVAKDIFKWYLEGMTVDGICYRLNRSGISTRRSNPWNKFNLRNILHNPVYAGYMRWDGILIMHGAEKAVSGEGFDRVQEIMSSRTKISMKKEILFIKDSELPPSPNV
ncbi:MAG: recombinase family protein [Methanomassiliicoccaceae archaeon]|jgi:DNA invertase Pin-like site-specific DNA recombinase|nr:recombinase family protein [Methanomassiliicoccaceae archaeon]